MMMIDDVATPGGDKELKNFKKKKSKNGKKSKGGHVKRLKTESNARLLDDNVAISSSSGDDSSDAESHDRGSACASTTAPLSSLLGRSPSQASARTLGDSSSSWRGLGRSAVIQNVVEVPSWVKELQLAARDEITFQHMMIEEAVTDKACAPRLLHYIYICTYTYTYIYHQVVGSCRVSVILRIGRAVCRGRRG